MKYRKPAAIVLLIVSLALAVTAYLVLPETVVVQVSFGGTPSNTMPKLIAVLIPTALGVGGALTALFAKEEGRGVFRALTLSGVGLLVFLLTFAVNLTGIL